MASKDKYKKIFTKWKMKKDRSISISGISVSFDWNFILIIWTVFTVILFINSYVKYTEISNNEAFNLINPENRKEELVDLNEVKNIIERFENRN